MKKKFILLAMMLLTLVGVKFNVLNAQETITIGSDEGFTKSSPTYNYYEYNLNQ